MLLLYLNLNEALFSATRQKRLFWFCLLKVYPCLSQIFPWRLVSCSSEYDLQAVCSIRITMGAGWQCGCLSPGTSPWLQEAGSLEIRDVCTRGASYATETLKLLICTSCVHLGLLPDKIPCRKFELIGYS